ncbi:MAG: MalY/PatB family protein [Clostridium sp.]
MVEFNKKVDRMGTFCTQWDYVEDRFGEKELLPFTISDMDLESPKEIIDAVIKRCNHKVFGYSRWNHSEFKGSIKNWYKRYDTYIKEEWVVYSPSVIYSIAKLFEGLSVENDGVTILTPAYDAFYNTIEGNKRKVIKCSLDYNEGVYTVDFEKFEECIKNSKIFLLCNPHNPTGRVWTSDELEKMINICKKYDVYIISDDIHMDIAYKRKYTPVFKVSDYEKMAIVTSASKTFNIPAFTGSYCLIKEKELMDKFLFILKNKEGLSSPAILGVIGTMVAYNECEYWLLDLLEHTKGNIEYTMKFLEENMKELKCTMPDGCYFAWINFKDLGVSSEELQEALIKKGKVAIMPGKTYGVEGEHFIRLNVGCSREKLEEGLKRLLEAYKYIKK